MIFRKIGYLTEQHIASWILFFRFIGHLCVSIVHAFSGKVRIPWVNIPETLYISGAKLVLPLMVISGLTGLIIALNIHYLLAPYDLQNKALAIAVTLMYRDVVPLLIGLVLCIQSALNLIHAEGHKLHSVPQAVVFEYLFPIVAGINLTAMMLYAYMITACLTSMFLTFHYVLHYDNFLMRLSSLISIMDLGWSVFKTAVYCTLVSLAVGYYYYEVAIRDLRVREAVSKIITRGLLWIMLTASYLKFFTI